MERIMIRDEIKRTTVKTLTELIIKFLLTFLISALIGGIAYFTVIKNKFIGEVSLALLITAITATILMLIWVIRMYWQHKRFQEAFGALWDKNYNMRCLSCKKPLKNSTIGPSIFFCSDPKCNS